MPGFLLEAEGKQTMFVSGFPFDDTEVVQANFDADVGSDEPHELIVGVPAGCSPRAVAAVMAECEMLGRLEPTSPVVLAA